MRNRSRMKDMRQVPLDKLHAATPAERKHGVIVVREGPDVMALPVCYGDGMAGTVRGFADLVELGFIRRLPRLVAGEVWGPLSNAQAEIGRASCRERV